MYALMLAVIVITCVIIAICIAHDMTTLPVLTSSTLIYLEPLILQDKLAIYNLSVRKTQTGYSGVVRASTWNGCSKNNVSPAFSYPYRIELDHTGKIINLDPVHLLGFDLTNCKQKFKNVYANGIEDPRIFLFHNEEWVIGNCLGSNEQPHPCVNTMCIFKLSNPSGTFCFLNPPFGTDILQPQKNWSPFEWNSELFCEYSLEPHVILKIDPQNGNSSVIYETGSFGTDIDLPTSLRCGVPPIVVDNKFLSIGHTRSSTNSGYLHFFYTFECQPPFNIIKRSHLFKLDKMETIQFVSGLSEADNIIYVSYGVNDCTNRIAQYKLDDILLLL